MKFLELLQKIEMQFPNDGVWKIEMMSDGSGDLFEPNEEQALTTFYDINHLELILEALLEHKPRTSMERVSLILDIA